MSRRLVLILLLTVAASYELSADPPALTATVEADLDRDGRRERVVMNGEGEGAIAIRRGRTVLWRGVPKSWKPWKLALADVDGDGRREIVLGVYKATHYFPKPHNCLFIYGWDGRELLPKWLGSSLSKPFTDFAFADTDADGRDNLVAIETTREGRRCVAVYSWNGFGFTLDWQRGDWTSARLLKTPGGELLIVADGARLPLTQTEKK